MSLFLVTAEAPTDLISVAQKALHDVALETVDLSLAAELTRTVADDLAGLEVAVEMQVRDMLLLLSWQQSLDDLPYLVFLIALLDQWLVYIALPIVRDWLFL